MNKAIYINEKTMKMYTSDGENLVPVYGPLKFAKDKRGRLYFICYCEEHISKNGNKYFTLSSQEDDE